MRTVSPAEAPASHRARQSSPRRRTCPSGRQSETTRAVAPMSVSAPIWMRRRRERWSQKKDSPTSTTAAAATRTSPQGLGTTKSARRTAPTKSKGLGGHLRDLRAPAPDGEREEGDDDRKPSNAGA